MGSALVTVQTEPQVIVGAFATTRPRKAHASSQCPKAWKREHTFSKKIRPGKLSPFGFDEAEIFR